MKAFIQGWLLQRTGSMTSGALKRRSWGAPLGPWETSMVSLPTVVGMVWMLCMVGSELRKSTVPPCRTAMTCGR